MRKRVLVDIGLGVCLVIAVMLAGCSSLAALSQDDIGKISQLTNNFSQIAQAHGLSGSVIVVVDGKPGGELYQGFRLNIPLRATFTAQWSGDPSRVKKDPGDKNGGGDEVH